jgi:hypothetical protein
MFDALGVPVCVRTKFVSSIKRKMKRKPIALKIAHQYYILVNAVIYDPRK